MVNINFKYDYPYVGYGEKGRFQYQWSESRVTLNKCYTYPLLFNTAVPGCLHITMDIEIENTGSGTVLGRSWISIFTAKTMVGMRYARSLCRTMENIRLTPIFQTIP